MFLNKGQGMLARLGVVMALVLPVALAAQTLPSHAVRSAGPITPAADFYISGSSVSPMLLAEWDADSRQGKTVQIVWGKEAVDKAPAIASRYEQKSYVFPTGTIRVLEFKKASGGMIHAITMETAIMMLKGTGNVGVAGQSVEIKEGDVVNYPSGVLRGIEDATVIAWSTTGTLLNEASKARVVRAADAKKSESAEWDVDGKRVRANKPEELAKAPADAIRLTLKRYDFPGNSVRIAYNKKGGPTSSTTGSLDSLIYVTSGKLHFFQGDKDVVVGPGDAIREIAGAQHHWIRLEDSSFIATSSAPVVPLTATKP